MDCPRCHKKMRQEVSSIGSAFHGVDRDSQLVSGWECSPAGCGHWIDIIEPPVKPMPRKSAITEMYQEQARSFVDRLANGEPTDHAIVRCNQYFNQYKKYIQVQLATGRTFNSIATELMKRYEDFPKQSWLRRAYYAWIEKEAVS